MPASIRPILMLWSALLLPGSEAGPGPGADATPAPRHGSPGLLASHAITAIEAMPPGREWPWRISEAGTTEDDPGEGDDLGPSRAGPSWGRPPEDRCALSAIRADGGSFRPPFRSPILRC